MCTIVRKIKAPFNLLIGLLIIFILSRKVILLYFINILTEPKMSF